MVSSNGSIESMQVLLKKFLIAAYLLTLRKKSFSVSDFAMTLKRTPEEALALLSVLKSIHMVDNIKKDNTKYHITSGGKNNLKIVLSGGVFDILHLGHIETLKEAKTYGDVLIVVVATDETVVKNKGRSPINNQENRAKLLSHLDVVDVVEIGKKDPSEFLDIVEKYKPDVITLGYDQSLTEPKLEELLFKRGLTGIEVVRLHSNVPEEKTSLKIKNLDSHSFE
ncbi:MAG: adenylyltransferase/cytidyltransferase family protein [Candidatus Hodarchaeales archaeon]